MATRLKNEPGIAVLRGLGDGELSVIESISDCRSVLSYEDFNEDGLPDMVYVDLSIPSRPDSDAWAFLHLQPTSGSNTGTGTKYWWYHHAYNNSRRQYDEQFKLSPN